MAIYCLDTSALVKRYVAETGTGRVRALCDPAAGHSIVISQAAHVETVATLCRKARDGKISTHDRDRIVAGFRRDVQRNEPQGFSLPATQPLAGPRLVNPL